MRIACSAAAVRAGLICLALAGLGCEATEFPFGPSGFGPPGEEETPGPVEEEDTSPLKAEAPVPIAPAEGSEVAETRPVLVASQAGGRFADAVFEYEFAVHRRAGSALAEVETGRGVRRGDGSTAYQVRTELFRQTSYVWRVRAVLDGAPGPWSADASFRTAAAQLTAPQPVVPSNGSVGIPYDACPNRMFTVWNAALLGRGGTVYVQVQVARHESFRNVLARAETFQRARGQTDLCLDVPLAPRTRYHWRARARLASDPGLVSDWSPVWSFTTASRR